MDGRDAKAMVEGIHLRNQVTFDKKMPLEFHAEVQKTYSLLTSIAGVLRVGALAAVILGLFLGGGGLRFGCCRASRRRVNRSFCGSICVGSRLRFSTDGPGTGQSRG